jgi:hypothetical protein
MRLEMTYVIVVLCVCIIGRLVLGYVFFTDAG